MRVVLLMFSLVLSGPVMALAVNTPARDDIALMIIPPWQDSAAIVAAVEGSEIGPTRARFAILVHVPDPDLTERAYAAGAWWITGGAGLAAICGVRI